MAHQGAPGAAGPKRLVRTPDRKIAGVAAGVAHYLGIDPTIVRIAFVALAFAGGIGLLLYGICFFVMPKGDIDERGPADPLDSYAVLGIAGLVVGVGLLVGWHGLGGGARAVIAAGLIVGGVLLLGRRRGSGDGDDGNPGRPVVPAPPPDTPAPPAARPETTATPDTTPAAATPYGAISGQTTREAAPAASRRRLPVTGLVLSALALAGAALVALALLDRLDLTAAAGLALAVIVVGAGLVVASMTGGAPVLFAVGGLLTAALLVTASVEGLVDDGVGDRSYVAASVSELRPAYAFGIGELTVDLAQLDLAGATRTVRVDLGIGRATVIVPDDVDLEVHADVDAGSIVLPGRDGAEGRRVEGWGKSVDWTDEAAGGAGLLVLDLELTFGEAVVRRG